MVWTYAYVQTVMLITVSNFFHLYYLCVNDLLTAAVKLGIFYAKNKSAKSVPAISTLPTY